MNLDPDDDSEETEGEELSVSNGDVKVEPVEVDNDDYDELHGGNTP